MKILIRTYNLETGEFSEKEVADLRTAELQRKSKEKIHICRHDEGLSCSLI